MIDTGIPFFERRIKRVLLDLGVGIREIHTIILTHGHLDHIGCLAYLKSLSEATLICHQSIATALESGGYEEAVPRVLGWRIFNPIVSPILQRRLNPVRPDRVFENTLDLEEYGLTGSLIHTPGHSPGSCSIFLDDGICFLGDLIRERSPGKIDTGLFFHDRNQIFTSLQKITALRPTLIYLSHGTTITGTDLDEFIDQSIHSEI
jgi:glyoxylase-like metal-dependent hydrolase (beta-lactamase superfamily II)